MADKKKTDVNTESKPKRKMLTPEERVAKLEAELEAAKVKAQSKDRNRHAALRDQLDKLVDRKGAIEVRIEDTVTELEEIEGRIPELASVKRSDQEG